MRIPLMTTLMVSALALGTAAHAQSASTDTATPPGQEKQMQSTPGNPSDTGAAAREHGMEQSGKAVDQQAEAQKSESGSAAGSAMGSASTASLEELMDKEVVGTAGEQVGEVSDVLVDADGKPQKVVIEHGGFLGMGQREVALDIGDIQMQGDQVQISTTKEELSAMPEWDSSQLADTGYTSQRGEMGTQGGAQTGATTGTGTTTGTGSDTTTPPTQPRTD